MITMGLTSVSFRQNTPEEILQACRNAGITAIEWGSDVHAPATDPEKLAHLAALQENYGVRCCSYGTYFWAGAHDPETLLPYIRGAQILGARVLRIWCGPKSSADYTNEEAAALVADCRTLARMAEEENVILCTEFHGGTYTDSAASTLSLLQAVNSPHFKTYWQPNQFRSFAENVAAAEAVAGLTQNIHVFNWKGNDKLPLSLARDEWKAYLGSFAGEHYALLEFMPDGRIESLPTEAHTLRQLMEE